MYLPSSKSFQKRFKILIKPSCSNVGFKKYFFDLKFYYKNNPDLHEKYKKDDRWIIFTLYL